VTHSADYVVAQYRKKPVVIEALRWDNVKPNCTAMYEFLGDSGCLRIDGTLEIATLEGVMRCDVGNWVIKGLAGEFYPCKPAIFEASYERLNDGTGAAE
jgi:hypothetical protein